MTSSTHLEDKLEIRELVERFADAATRMDVEAFLELWLPDGKWIIGDPLPLAVQGKDELRKAFSSLVGNWNFFAQFVHTILVDVAGDSATARCTCEELGLNSVSGKSYHNVALYIDRLTRTSAGWRFSARNYHYLWIEAKALDGQVFAVPSIIGTSSANIVAGPGAPKP